MNTIIIWDELDAELLFLVFDSDLRKFDNIYINAQDDQPLQDELCALIYTNEGKFKPVRYSLFPYDQFKGAGQTFIIRAGFLP